MKLSTKLLSILALSLSSASYSMEHLPLHVERTASTSPSADIKSLFAHDGLNRSTPYEQLQKLESALQQQAQDNDVEGMISTLTLIKELHLIEGPGEIGPLKLYTALYHAVNYGNYEATKLLLELQQINLKSNPNNILHMVCFGKWHENEHYTVDIIKRMLEAGANINKISYNRKTPLDLAYGTPHAVSHVRDDAPKSVQEFLVANGAKKSFK